MEEYLSEMHGFSKVQHGGVSENAKNMIRTRWWRYYKPFGYTVE